jgi:polyhydroxyalkanoic acid synthase PhaR subunit
MSERSEAPDQKDLFALWRQLYDANEKVWSQATGEFMESPAFAQWQGKMLETFLSFQKAWKDSATAQLEAANIATRDDLVRLGELIVGLEEKVDQIADRLGAAPAAPVRRARAAPNARRSATRAKPKKRGSR